MLKKYASIFLKHFRNDILHIKNIHVVPKTLAQQSYTDISKQEDSPLNLFSADVQLLGKIADVMKVYDDFITDSEEKSLIEEIEPYIKQTRYQYDHWDDAIHGYRETEKSKWNKSNEQIINRIRASAFPPNVNQLEHVHCLDLAKNGFIKPHIDSTRFCGNTIAGLSLLSTCVMRLIHEKHKSMVVDVLVKRRSLYIMKDLARYEFTHEILEDAKSFFKEQHIPRERRISVICRNEPID